MQRNRIVDVLKGLLILFVLITHTWITPETRLKFLFPFWIDMAVPAFMLLSGYVSALSLKRVGDHAVSYSYLPKTLCRKLLRFVVPFTIAFVADRILICIFGPKQILESPYGFFQCLLDYLSGGRGQGSYYFPVMVQFVFLFPVIYFVIKKYEFKGLLGCFGANLFFEILKLAYGMGEPEYRLLVFKYLSIIAVGTYVAIGDFQKYGKKKWLVLSIGSFAVGAFFIYLFSYTGYVPKILIYWKETSFVASLFIAPILGWAIGHIRFGFPPLELIGKASFHIFLVQMVYYNYIWEMYLLIPNVLIHLLVSMANCVLVGVIFYYLETKLSMFVAKKFNLR